MEKEKNDIIEIDIKQIAFLLLGKIGYILAIGVILAILAFTYFKFIAAKSYTSSAQLYVMNTESDSITTGDIQISTYLTTDCLGMITSRPVLEKVISELDLGMSANALAGKISSSNTTGSRLITITVTDSSPVMAKRIVDAVAKASAEHIKQVTNAEYVNQVYDGEVATAPSSPAVMRNTLIAMILGIAIGCAIVVIRFLLDDSIKGADDVEKFLGITVIGTIPLFGVDEDAGMEYKRGKKIKKAPKKQKIARK